MSGRSVVWGLGRHGGGAAAVRQLVRAGREVTVLDRASADDLKQTVETLPAGVTLRLEEDDPTRLLGPDVELVVNPAIPPSHAAWPAVLESGCRLTSPFGLLLHELAGKRIVAVTGSNGKSTLTAWIANALNAVGVPATVGGNFECDLLGLAALPDRLEELSPETVFVLEVSSFQLARLYDDPFEPIVGVVTNCTPNHLDWHGSFEDYVACKSLVLRSATRLRILPSSPDDAIRRRFVGGGEVASMVPVDPAGPESWPSHVRESAGAVARIVTDLYGKVNEETLVLSRPQLSHRFQTVRDDRAVAGLRWVNDSAATAPESTLRGLEEVGRDSVLILGGRNKGFDLDSLTRSVAGRAWLL